MTPPATSGAGGAPGEFTGFPSAALDFYDDLEVDNTKSYWEAHKHVYAASVKAPMTALCQALEPEFGQAKIFRPYRDVRFAKDKTPYKTHQGAFVAVGPATGWYVEISPRGLFRPTSRPVPLDGRDLPLTEELLASEALCFLDVRSRGLRFRAPDGCAIRIETEGFPHLALWTRPGAPFLSIESWTGHGDPEGFAGDITEKPSIRLLPAGGEDTCRVRYSFESGD